MAIPESQLDTWSHQGSITQSSTTYNTIKKALESTGSAYAGKNYTVFLQGSYGNDTNIYSESDVDIVIRLNSCFYHDLESHVGWANGFCLPTRIQSRFKTYGQQVVHPTDCLYSVRRAAPASHQHDSITRVLLRNNRRLSASPDGGRLAIASSPSHRSQGRE